MDFNQIICPLTLMGSVEKVCNPRCKFLNSKNECIFVEYFKNKNSKKD